MDFAWGLCLLTAQADLTSVQKKTLKQAILGLREARK
jgi:hypothetical protein